MNKRIFWSLANQSNLEYFVKLQNSFKKFHPREEIRLFDDLAIEQTRDPNIFYRATPYFSKRLMEEGYDAVCKLDADQLITGNLDHIWEGEFDVAVVKNSNPRENAVYPIRLLDINPFDYANCGFVVMKSKGFVDHWLRLCMSYHFNSFQYREQDLLNIMVHYGDYKIRFLDNEGKFHGLASKGYWPQIELRDKKLILPANQEWNKEDVEVVCLHWAGGNQPNKMKDFNIRFKSIVAEYLQKLCGN